MTKISTPDLSEKFKQLRQTAKLSQTEIAELFSIPKGTYAHWEQGLVAPPIYVYNMMSAIINKSVTDDMKKSEIMASIKKAVAAEEEQDG